MFILLVVHLLVLLFPLYGFKIGINNIPYIEILIPYFYITQCVNPMYLLLYGITVDVVFLLPIGLTSTSILLSYFLIIKLKKNIDDNISVNHMIWCIITCLIFLFIKNTLLILYENTINYKILTYRFIVSILVYPYVHLLLSKLSKRV